MNVDRSNTMRTTNTFLDAEGARQLSKDLLAKALPRRWSHTMAVAKAAAGMAKTLAPDDVDEIVCAAWLHDIGYAPDLIETRFHPLDGAAYLARDVAGRQNISPEVISLVAHHTGAVYEARERGLQDLLASYPQPDETKLAILSCADLCSGPDGAPVDPAERISEVLARYPTDHPVHRAITISAPTLVAQSRRILQAARDDCRLCQQLVETRQENITRLQDRIALNEAEIAEIERGDRHSDYPPPAADAMGSRPWLTTTLAAHARTTALATIRAARFAALRRRKDKRCNRFEPSPTTAT